MQHQGPVQAAQSLRFDRADLEIQAAWTASALTIEIVKSGACVHRLIIDDAASPIEHRWFLDLLAREDRVSLGTMAQDADEFLIGLDVNQG
ncbi:MAG: hypothetical protein NW223_00805 [Hyphomicrobiaceae bacterium]|nr:hypothetical protein [Hyphomicrobiaceae bacterium]